MPRGSATLRRRHLDGHDRAPDGGARLRLALLEGFAVERDGVSLDLPPSAQRVLAFVALHTRPLQRAYVAGSLWADSSEERAHACLRSALWRLGRGGHRLVTGSPPLLRLCDEVAVDLRESELLARAALAGAVDEGLVTALALGGDLLPDWYDDWVLLERERYRQLRLRALDELCERLADAGRFTEAFEAGLASVTSDPLRESAHRALVRMHLAEGNVGEAVRQYQLCRHLLEEQLGLEPSGLMDELVAHLERSDHGLATFRGLPRAEPRPGDHRAALARRVTLARRPP